MTLRFSRIYFVYDSRHGDHFDIVDTLARRDCLSIRFRKRREQAKAKLLPEIPGLASFNLHFLSKADGAVRHDVPTGIQTLPATSQVLIEAVGDHDGQLLADAVDRF